jgi:hypothetical protein
VIFLVDGIAFSSQYPTELLPNKDDDWGRMAQAIRDISTLLDLTSPGVYSVLFDERPNEVYSATDGVISSTDSALVISPHRGVIMLGTNMTIGYCKCLVVRTTILG